MKNPSSLGSEKAVKTKTAHRLPSTPPCSQSSRHSSLKPRCKKCVESGKLCSLNNCSALHSQVIILSVTLSNVIAQAHIFQTPPRRVNPVSPPVAGKERLASSAWSRGLGAGGSSSLPTRHHSTTGFRESTAVDSSKRTTPLQYKPINAGSRGIAHIRPKRKPSHLR